MIFEGSECQFQRCTQPHTYANACGLQMGSKRCNSICIGAIRTICTLTVRLLLVIMDHFLSVQVLVSHLILYILLKLCAFQTPNDSQRDRNYMANRVKNANKSRSTQLIQLASHMLRIRVCVSMYMCASMYRMAISVVWKEWPFIRCIYLFLKYNVVLFAFRASTFLPLNCLCTEQRIK